MKVRTIKRGRRTIYQLREDGGDILTAASVEFIDYLNNAGKDKPVDDGHLNILCQYRFKKIKEGLPCR